MKKKLNLNSLAVKSFVVDTPFDLKMKKEIKGGANTHIPDGCTGHPARCPVAN